MAVREIDIFAGLRTRAVGANARQRLLGVGSGKNKVTIEFTAPSLTLHVDDDAVLKDLAETCATVMRDNMLAGKTPSGTDLPASKPGTIKRRKYRELQAKRDGDVAPRYKRDGKQGKKFYRNAKRSYFSRYKTRAGTFTPGRGVIHGRFGVESGLLAKTLVGIKSGPGKFSVVAANARSIADRTGQAALTRVFGPGGISVWSQYAMKDGRIQDSLKRVQASMFKHSSREFAHALVETFEHIEHLGETLESADGG